MIGFLSPKAEWFECKSWGHLDKAVELCKDLFDKEFHMRQDAEEYLLSLGFVVLRARDAYMNYFDENKEYICLTDEQCNWLADYADAFNEGQKKDLNEILNDQEDIRKRPSRLLK